MLKNESRWKKYFSGKPQNYSSALYSTKNFVLIRGKVEKHFFFFVILKQTLIWTISCHWWGIERDQSHETWNSLINTVFSCSSEAWKTIRKAFDTSSLKSWYFYWNIYRANEIQSHPNYSYIENNYWAPTPLCSSCSFQNNK